MDSAIVGTAISFLTLANVASQDFFSALFVSISQHCIKTEIILFNLVHRWKDDSMTASWQPSRAYDESSGRLTPD